MYESPTSYEQNMRNPKNRFLLCFCHANEVDDSWGCKCPFWVGVVILSIIEGCFALSDIPLVATLNYLPWFTFFTFMIFLRCLSSFIALIGIIYALTSICQSNYRHSVIAYYCLFVTFVINTAFSIYCIYIIFRYLNRVKFRLLAWLTDEFLMILFCWFLFCNMVVIGRRNKQTQQTNYFS